MIVHPDRPYRSTLRWPGMRTQYCRLPPDDRPTVTYAQPTRAMITSADGKQPGDPAKAAAAIITALDAERTPLRLALGHDAVDAIRPRLDSIRAELSEWEHVSRSTDLD